MPDPRTQTVERSVSWKDRNMKVSILQVNRCKPIPGLYAFDHAPVRQHLKRGLAGPGSGVAIQDWSNTTVFLGYDEIRAVKPLLHLGWRDRLDCILARRTAISSRKTGAFRAATAVSRTPLNLGGRLAN